MPVSPRPDLDGLPAYVPGQAIPGAIKLASNEVPLGPLPSVERAIADAATAVNRYPDMGAVAVVERLAERFGFPADRISVGCGSVSLCQQIIQATCTTDDEVLFAWRSFEAYPIITQVVGAGQRKVPLDGDYTHDLDAMLAAITSRTKVVFVCNPNNPTGTAVRRDALQAFLDAVPEGVLVALDEAYREYVTDPDVPDGFDLARDRDNVAVLRTFSKAYGLAGLRIGYMVASETVTAAVRKVCVPFSVNRIAQAAALASLDAADELLTRCAELTQERDRVRDALLSAGYDIPPSQANFVWLPLGERTTEFAEHTMASKVIVRPFAGDGARVTIGTPDENDTFLDVARSFPR